MTSDELAALLGVVTSLLFSYFPVIKDWFDKQASNTKRLIQVGLATVVAFGIFGLSCFGVLNTFTCDWPGVVVVLRLIGAFLIANQTAYSVTPRK